MRGQPQRLPVAVGQWAFVSPWKDDCVLFLETGAWWPLPDIEYRKSSASNKKPSVTGSRRACFLVEYAAWLTRAAEYQLERSPLMTSPNSSHFSPLKRCSCNCEIGAKSVAEVL